MWFFLALLSALLWTAISLYDTVAVRTVFSRPSQGLFISGMFSGVGLLFAFSAGWSIPTLPVFCWVVVSALLLQFSQYFYFQAMEREEVGDLVAYGSTYPILVALLALTLGKPLSFSQWVGIAVVALGVACIEWKRTSHSIKAKIDISFYIAGLALSSLVIDEVLDHVSFVDTVIPYCLGLVLGGLAPMLLASQREELRAVWPSIEKNLVAFGFIEVINVIAVLCEVSAIGIGHPALVNAVASAEPAFVIIFAQMLGGFSSFKNYFPKTSKLHHKLLIVVIIAIGLMLIAKS